MAFVSWWFALVCWWLVRVDQNWAVLMAWPNIDMNRILCGTRRRLKRFVLRHFALIPGFWFAAIWLPVIAGQDVSRPCCLVVCLFPSINVWYHERWVGRSVWSVSFISKSFIEKFHFSSMKNHYSIISFRSFYNNHYNNHLSFIVRIIVNRIMLFIMFNNIWLIYCCIDWNRFLNSYTIIILHFLNVKIIAKNRTAIANLLLDWKF